MLRELYTASLAMQPQQTRLEVIANNLSNANTPGFKRESVFERNLTDARANFYNAPGDVEQDDPPFGAYTDFQKGAFEETSNPLDFAIENENGFFVVQDEDGNDYYTKSGHFLLGEDGTIVTTDGKRLMGEEGPINILNEAQLDVNNLNSNIASNLRITEDGEVFLNDKRVNSVMLMQFDDLSTLERISNSNFTATEFTEGSTLLPDDVKIRQGWLEHSNVDIIKEMVQMIELQRMFELNSKVIQTNDGTLDHSMRLGRYY